MKSLLNKMLKHKLAFVIIISGILSVFGSIYAVLFNESRLIVPTDLNTYQFKLQDLIFGLPVVIFIFSVIIASVYYPIKIFKNTTFKKYELGEYTDKTNINSCLWGIFGFIPLFFYTKYSYEIVVFFAFFGFFSCYYKSKFNEILIDERFLFNQSKADAQAYRVAFTIIAVSFILSVPRISGVALNTFLLSIIALSYAVAEILKSYYLYKYDMEE